MASETSARSKCLSCGLEAPAEEWATVSHPPFGTMTQCPECGSTDVRGR